MLSAMSPLTVSLAVSEILDKQGMSTAEFAERARLTYNQALNLRRGSNRRIDLDTLGRICEALNVQPCDLLQVKKSEIS